MNNYDEWLYTVKINGEIIQGTMDEITEAIDIAVEGFMTCGETGSKISIEWMD